MRVKKRLFWYFGGHLPRRAVAMTAQPEQLLQQTTGTELGGAISRRAHMHAHYLNSHSSPSQHLPPALLLNAARAGGEERLVCAGTGAGETREWRGVIFPTRSGKLEGGGGRSFVEECAVEWGVRGKGRRAIVLRQQISKVAWSQCQVSEWAGRRCTVDTESKIATCTSTSCHLKTHT